MRPKNLAFQEKTLFNKARGKRMKNSNKLLIANLFFANLAFTCFGGIKIGSFPINRFVESENTGTFVKVLREIEKRTGVSCDLTISPVKRVMGDFETKQIVAYFPAVPQTMPKNAIATKPYTHKKIFAFSQISTPIANNIDDLKGKTIGLTTGYSYGAEIEKLQKDGSVKTEYVENDVSGFQMLVRGRIDFFIADETSGLKAIESSNTQSSVTYNKAQPICLVPIFFAFQPENKDTADNFSAAIEAMGKDGTLDQILSAEK